MRNIVFAGDWVVEQAVGVQRYTYQILLELDKMLTEGVLDYNIELLVPCNANWQNPFKNIRVINKGRVNSKTDKHIWQQLVFPFYVKRKKAIGVDLAGAFPIWGCRICALHDCIRERFPENFNSHGLYLRIYYFKAKKIANNKKNQIVTLTDDSKNELKHFYKIPDDRLNIVSCGWEHMLQIGTDNSIFDKIGIESDTPYFFSLGSKYKHKNFKWVLATAKKNPQYKFVITGTGAFSNNENELKREIPSNVIFTGYISDEEIKSLMMKCKALIQPSYYEGFGLPPLEAMSVGAKTIVSNASCLPEIYGDASYYIDPNSDGCDLDTLMSGKIGECDSVLKKYNWENAAKQLVMVINLI